MSCDERHTILVPRTTIFKVAFFFLRLPNGQYGPVSQLSCPETTKEAVQVHLIGAVPIVQVKAVKRKIGPFLQKSHQKQANNQNKQGTARHGNQEPPGQAPSYTGQEANNTTPRDFEHRSRYALTYIEVFRSMCKSNNVQRLIPHCM